ncbi:MAG: hypothetical protein ABSE63_15335, partial [Thermoguttaceae bacterium]
TLLAIDSRMPTSSAEAREVAKQVLRRDRRRVRLLTRATIGFFLLTVIGICFFVYFYCLKFAPAMDKYQQLIAAMEQELSAHKQQLAKQEPQPSTPDLLTTTAGMTIGQGWALFFFQAVILWATVALFVVMLAAAFCTVLLMVKRRNSPTGEIPLAVSRKRGRRWRFVNGYLELIFSPPCI